MNHILQLIHFMPIHSLDRSLLYLIFLSEICSFHFFVLYTICLVAVLNFQIIFNFFVQGTFSIFFCKKNKFVTFAYIICMIDYMYFYTICGFVEAGLFQMFIKP